MKDKLVCHFQLGVDVVRGGIREFLHDKIAFLKSELVVFGVNWYE